MTDIDSQTVAAPANHIIDGGISVIPAETLRAYAKTRYEVLVNPPFVQFIGKHSPALAKLMAQHGVQTASTMSAWNPESILTDDATNAAAQARFMADLDAAGLAHVPVFGADPAGIWPGEESRLVLGASQAQIIALGRRYRQNAVTFATADATPHLLLLR